MATAIETLSLIARKLIQSETRFAGADEPKRQRTSRLFTRISSGIGALVSDLNRDKLPHAPCRELTQCSSKLAEAISDEVGPQEAERLAEALGKACEKEVLYLEFRRSPHKPHLIEEMEKSSILLQALAHGIYRVPMEGLGRTS